MIYIIGDSHVSVFSGTDKTHDGLRHIQPEFGTCYTLSGGQLRPHINKFEQRVEYFCPIKTGSNTAYNSYNKLPRIEQAITEYGINPTDDFIFLSFGEIDIRNHIGFNITPGVTISEKIIECVDRYILTLLHLKDKGFKVGAYAPPPSSIGTPGSPIEYGNVKIRNKMTLAFNNYLKGCCQKNDILFKSITNKMVLSNGTTDESYIMDDIHLSQKAMPLIIEEFKDLIWVTTDAK